MAATILGEPAVSRSGSNTNRDVKFLVGGTSDDVEAETVVGLAAPASWSGLYLRGFSIEQLALEYWLITAHYGEGQALTLPVATGSAQYEFAYQAEAVRVYQSINTISRNAPAGQVATDHGGAINVKHNGNGGVDIDGEDLPAGSPTSVWTFYPAAISSFYEAYIESIMGTVCLTPFQNRPIGEIRFVSCSGGVGAGSRPQIRFGFQRSVNRSNFVVGGTITIPFKAGHHLMWAEYSSDVDNAAKKEKANLLAVYVEQVIPGAVWASIGF